MPDAPDDPGQPVLETQLVAPTVLAPAEGPRFTVGGALSRTLRVWWAHVWAFSGMSLVVFAPLLAALGLVFGWALRYARPGTAPEPSELVTRVALVFGATALTLVLSVVQMGAIAYGTVQWLRGERAPLGRMLGVGLRRGLPVVGTALVVWVATVAGMFLLFVPGVLFLVAASVAIPAAVVERPGVAGALRRSFELTRGNRWPLFAAGLAVVAIQWVLSAVVQVASLAVLGLVTPGAAALGATLFTTQLGNALFSVLPVVAVAVCYHDLRLAKEGVDTAELARVFE